MSLHNLLSSSEGIGDDVPMPPRYNKKRKSHEESGLKTTKLKLGGRLTSNSATGTQTLKREPSALADKGPSTIAKSKYSLHLLPNRRKVGYVSIEERFEELVVHSSFLGMFLIKDVEEDNEEPYVDDVGSFKNTTEESNITSLHQDLECSSSDDNDVDGENDEEELGNRNDKNNNDEDSSITISSDSEDEENPLDVKPSITSRTKEVSKEMRLTDRFRLFYENYEGTVKKRRVRCKLCPGIKIVSFTHFRRHIRNVHENHGRKECEFCRKDFAYSTIVNHRKACQKKAVWSNIELN